MLLRVALLSTLSFGMVASSPDVGISVGSGSAIMSRLVAVDPRAGDTPTRRPSAPPRAI